MENPRSGLCVNRCLTIVVFPDPEGAEKISALPAISLNLHADLFGKGLGHLPPAAGGLNHRFDELIHLVLLVARDAFCEVVAQKFFLFCGSLSVNNQLQHFHA